MASPPSRPLPSNRSSKSGKPDDDWLRQSLYEIIFESDTWAGKLFDIVLLVAILGSMIAVSLETVPSVRSRYGPWLVKLEWFFTILFTIEYALRLYCVGDRRRYATSFYGIIDLLSILPTYFGLVTTGSGSFAILRSFRLMRVFRILELFRMTSDAESLTKAVWDARGKVIVFLTFVGICVTVSGTLMYEIENFQVEDSSFTSIPQSIYWAIVTMTTVGYGDVAPQTPLGKFVSALLILIGYSLIIVPTGFVSAELMHTKQRQRYANRTCSHCLLEGHEPEARYCRDCGHELN